MICGYTFLFCPANIITLCWFFFVFYCFVTCVTGYTCICKLATIYAHFVVAGHIICTCETGNLCFVSSLTAITLYFHTLKTNMSHIKGHALLFKWKFSVSTISPVSDFTCLRFHTQKLRIRIYLVGFYVALKFPIIQKFVFINFKKKKKNY